jgi:hypothetical protein
MDRRLLVRRNRILCMAVLIVPDLFLDLRSVDPLVHPVAKAAATQYVNVISFRQYAQMFAKAYPT